MDRIIQLSLYAGAPFFAYPHKPLVNRFLLENVDYTRAYKHFFRDHSDQLNLILHCVCLVFQLGSNFGMHADLDRVLGSSFSRGGGGEKDHTKSSEEHILAFSTAAIWAASLAYESDAPVSVRISSVAAIALAYRSRLWIRRNWLALAYLQSVLEILAIQIFLINRIKPADVGTIPPGWFNPAVFAALLGFRLAAQAVLTAKFKGRVPKAPVNILIAAFILQSCRDPFGGKVPPFLLGLVGWALSIVTNQPWLFFYSGGFLATLGQGTSHFLSCQPATLPQMQTLSDEMAHVVFFPNLVFQTAFQMMKAT